jgi:hypothetical protein
MPATANDSVIKLSEPAVALTTNRLNAMDSALSNDLVQVEPVDRCHSDAEEVHRRRASGWAATGDGLSNDSASAICRLWQQPDPARRPEMSRSWGT